MPKKEMIGAHKPSRYTGGGPFLRSTRNVLPSFNKTEVKREIYLAAKRVQARPMRAINQRECVAVPAQPLAPVISLPVAAPTSPKQPSRQQRWMARQEAAGNCRRCGQSRNLYAQFCDGCMDKVRNRRAKVGNEKRPGRPLKK